MIESLQFFSDCLLKTVLGGSRFLFTDRVNNMMHFGVN